MKQTENLDQPPGLRRMAYNIEETAEMLGVSPATIRRWIKRGLLRCSSASRHKLIAVLEFHQFIHCRLPVTRCSGGITCLPIHSRQLTTECWPVLRFIFGCDKTIGFILVTGFKGGLLLGNEVFAVECAPSALKYTVTILHSSIHVVNMNQLDSSPLASSGRVRPG